MLIELLRMAEFFFFFQECRTLKDSCLYPFFRIFLPCYDFPFFLPSSFSVFQSFNPLFLHPFPCAYARVLALLTRV